MSKVSLSKADVVRVKGVSFNYLQFLWGGIGQIRQQQSQGNFSGSMEMLSQFLDYLPDSMKEEFRDRAKKISSIMKIIKAGSLTQIQEIPDLYIRGIYKNRLLQTYSHEALSSFMNDMTSKLNLLGYMENLKVVLEGDVEQQDWIEEQAKRERAVKKKKKPRSPQGNVA